MVLPHVLLYEPDATVASVLLDLFADEHIAVTTVRGVEELKQAVDLNPEAIVVTSTWETAGRRDLSTTERENITDLASKTWVIVAGARQHWEQLLALPGSERIIFLEKPFDLEDMLKAIATAVSTSRG